MDSKISIIEEMLRTLHLASNVHVQLSSKSQKELAQILGRQDFKKGEIICRQGDICDKIRYVEKGTVRQFYYKYDKPITEHFTAEGGMFVNIESFIRQEPSYIIAEALEAVSTYYFAYHDLEDLARSMPEVQYFYRCMFGASLIVSQIKADLLRCETARGRYEHFIKTYPGLIRKVPLQYIASYLLMTRESLSRIRAGKL